MQNLSVLTRGNTLRPEVLLLGGPNYLHPGHARLLEAQHPEDLGGAQHSAAGGRAARGPDPDARQRAVLRGHRRGGVRQDRGRPTSGRYHGYEKLRVVHRRRPRARRRQARRLGGGLAKDAEELAAFKEQVPPQASSSRPRSSRARWWKASSASTAAPPPPRPCCSRRTRSARILAKAYQLSKGNPIEDTMEMLRQAGAADRRAGRAR